MNNTFEEILIKRHLVKLTDCMYWNNREDSIIVYTKLKENPENINPKPLVDSLLKMDYYKNDFFFTSTSFDTTLVKTLIDNGFIILSSKSYINKYNKYLAWSAFNLNKKFIYSKIMMFGVIYNKYPILFLNNVNESKAALKMLHKYELKVNIDFEKIVDKCNDIHGDAWLNNKLKNCFKKLYKENNPNFKFISFALYRDNELKAGDFGIIHGKMYISYCGFYEESGSGMVQMIKMFRYLKNTGIICCNLFGNDSESKYKHKLGAVDINRNDYIELFRKICIEPKGALDFHNRGIVYLENEYYENAIHDFNEAIKLDSSCAPSYFSRGAVHFFFKNLEQCIKDIEKSIELDPENEQYKYWLGKIKEKL